MRLGMAGVKSRVCFKVGQNDPVRLGGSAFATDVSDAVPLASGTAVSHNGWRNMCVWRFFNEKRLAVCPSGADDDCGSDIRVFVAGFVHQTPPCGGTHCDEHRVCHVVFR